MSKKHICIIGLGQFGRELALQMASDCEVLAIDIDEYPISLVGDRVQRAVILDARDFQSLSKVVSKDFDAAVVASSEALEVSILCTLHLKKIGVPVIYAKAANEDHAQILTSVGATHIVFPERESAARTSAQIGNPAFMDFIPLVKDFNLIEIPAPDAFIGKSLLELNIRKTLQVFVLAIKEEGEYVFLPEADFVIQRKHQLVIIGREKDLQRFQTH